jgi:hypothetical protein
MTELKETVRKLRAMANRADSMARTLERYRTAGTMVAGDTAMAAAAQIATSARDFHTAVEASFAALPKDLRDALQ